jgi:hypothetical protein
MKAITVCQPYAHLITTGRKTCENRTWETRYRGPLLIHAGKSRRWLDLDDDGKEYGVHVDWMAFGAVVAIATLVGCIHTDSRLLPEWVGKMTDEQRAHVHGPFCWILAGVQELPRPIPYRGAQGLWECSAVIGSSEPPK